MSRVLPYIRRNSNEDEVQESSKQRPDATRDPKQVAVSCEECRPTADHAGNVPCADRQLYEEGELAKHETSLLREDKDTAEVDRISDQKENDPTFKSTQGNTTMEDNTPEVDGYPSIDVRKRDSDDTPPEVTMAASTSENEDTHPPPDTAHAGDSRSLLQEDKLPGESETCRKEKCKVCDKYYSSQYSLLKHIDRVHRGLRAHVCSVCRWRFFNTSDLASHMRTHRSTNSRSKYSNGKSSNQVKANAQHPRNSKRMRGPPGDDDTGDIHSVPQNNKGEKHNSLKCGVRNENFASIKQRHDTNKMNKGRVQHVCGVCHRGFYSWQQLTVHMSSHKVGNVRSNDSGNAPHEAFVVQRPPRHENTRGNSDKTTPQTLNSHTHGEKARSKVKCNICAKYYSTSGALKHHVHRVHRGLRPHVCDICDKGFFERGDLTVHMRSHTGEKPFQCNVCSMWFSQSSSLHRHVATHLGLAPFTSSHKAGTGENNNPGDASDGVTVGANTQRPPHHENTRGDSDVRKPLTHHSHTHGEKAHSKVKCNICAQYYSTSKYLKHHVDRVHRGIKPHVCDICDKGFIVRGDLTVHMRSHTGEKPFQCSVCSKWFSQSSNLRRHMATHSELAPFTCSHKAGTGEYNPGDASDGVSVGANTQRPPHHEDTRGDSDVRKPLTHHSHTHGEKAHSKVKCNICAQYYSTSKYLKHHVDRVHRGIKPHVCDISDKRFGLLGDLTVHMRSHTGEKPFQCSVCSKWFSQRSNLKTHMAIHSGRTFTCRFCEQGLSRADNLTKHVMVKHPGETPFQCNTCGKEFMAFGSLKRHSC